MGLPVPATVTGAYGAIMPASFVFVSPGGVVSPAGVWLVPSAFPFGAPVTVAGGYFFAIPATTVELGPAAI